jgi:hypothetical protein
MMNLTNLVRGKMSSSQSSGYAPLPNSFRGGLTVTIVRGQFLRKAIVICCAVSCAASFSLLCFLAYQAIKTKSSRGSGRSAMQNNTPQGYFWLVQLFIAGIVSLNHEELTVSDFLESFSALFIIRYLTENSLVTGPYCTFQAVALISGVVGSAVWTFVITLNTFLLLAGGRNTRAWLIEKSTSGWERWVFCIAIWIFILFSALFGFIEPLSAAKGPYCKRPEFKSLTFR